jgi:signal transduction histidine kinase
MRAVQGVVAGEAIFEPGVAARVLGYFADLSGIAFTADAARNSIRSVPDRADQLLRQLRADAAAGVGDIRRLVYGMHPPVLAELGLVPALRQQTASVRTAAGRRHDRILCHWLLLGDSQR